MNTESPANTLSIHLLGGFRVSVGGEEIPAKRFRLHKARSLVKLLALAPKHQLHREQIMEQLWPDFEPRFAAANLRQTIYIARRTLGVRGLRSESCLSTQDEILCLGAPGEVWVDVEAFESAAAWARWSKDIASIQSALSLYTGDLLLEDCYEDWCAPRRECLRQEYLELLLALAGLHSERREYQQAIQSLQQVLAAEPEREDAHVALMRLYALSGQRTLAVRQYETLQAVLNRELAAEPGEGSKQLYQEILSGKYPGTAVESTRPVAAPEMAIASLPRHNLPTRLSSFIGREAEIEALQHFLENARLVTLTGTGGVGKSSLALQCAAQVVSDFPDGVWLVELAPLSDPQLVPQTVAGLFHLQPDEQGNFLPILKSFLEARQLLLVLDNCEHLIAACAGLGETLLKACPYLHIIATSRERLGIQGEQVYYVPSLPFPELADQVNLEAGLEYESVQLFVERARAVLPGFQLSAANAPAVARICQRLDGIPLAIELAAARVTLLIPEQIASRLDDAFHLLSGGERTALPRHKTLRASIELSYNLLSDAEQALLRRLSVFAGGWTLEAAESVCSIPDVTQTDQSTNLPISQSTHLPPITQPPNPPDFLAATTLDLLGSLVHKSLVLAERRHESETRYRLLETSRQYAHEKLAASGEEPAVRQRHLEYFLQLGETVKAKLCSAGCLDWLLRMKPERDNFRAALSWSLDETPQVNAEKGLRLSNVFARVLPYSDRREYLDWAQKGLARLAAGRALERTLHADTLLFVGGTLWNDAGFQMMKTGITLLKEDPQTNPHDLAAALIGTAWESACIKGDRRQALEMVDESIAILRPLGDSAQYLLAGALRYACAIAIRDSEYLDSALSYGQESYNLFMQAGDPVEAGIALDRVAEFFQIKGDYSKARSLRETAIQQVQQVKPECEEFIRYELIEIMDDSGILEYEAGNYTIAYQQFQVVLSEYLKIGMKVDACVIYGRLGKTAIALGELNQAAAHLRSGIQMCREIQSESTLAVLIAALARLIKAQGEIRTAAVLLGAVKARSSAWLMSTRTEYQACIEATKSALGEAAFAAAFSEGKAMTLEQATDYAEEILAKLETGQDLTTKYTKDNTKDTN